MRMRARVLYVPFLLFSSSKEYECTQYTQVTLLEAKLLSYIPFLRVHSRVQLGCGGCTISPLALAPTSYSRATASP